MNFSWKKNITNSSYQLILLIVIILIIQSNVLYNQFAIDDGIAYIDNVYVKKGVWGWKEVLIRPYFEGHQLNQTQAGGNQIVSDLPGDRWRPLFLLLLTVEREFFGINPLGGHIVSLFFLVVNCILLYFFLKRYVFKELPFGAFWATLIFAILPIHAEVIANIKSQDELLSFIFALLALLLGLRYSSGKWYYLIGCVVFYLLSLLTKESATMFFFIIPMAMYFYNDTNWKKIIWTGILLLLCFCTYLFFRFQVTGINFSPSINLYNDPYLLATFEQKWSTIIYVTVYNLGLLIYPIKYAWDYQYCVFPYLSWGHPKFIFSIVILLTLIIIALFGLLNKKNSSFALIFFGANFILVNNMVINLGSYLDERCLYLPSVGYVIFFIVVVIAFYQFSIKYINAKIIQLSMAFFFICYSFFCISKLRIRNSDWYNSSTLFIDTINFPQNGKLQRGAGEKYSTQAILAFEKYRHVNPDCIKNLDTAKIYLERAVEIYPDDRESVADLAAIYDFTHQNSDSLKCCLMRNGLRIGQTTKKIAILYMMIGDNFYAKRMQSLADSLWEKAYFFDNNNKDITYKYAMSCYHNNKFEIAKDIASQALALDKDNYQVQRLASNIQFKIDSIANPEKYKRLHLIIENIKKGKIDEL